MTGPDESHARARVEELLLRHHDRLLARIRWMMGEPARNIAESQDFLSEATARILSEVASLQWRDDDHFLALATRIARHLIVDRVRRPRVRRFDSFTQTFSSREADDGSTPSQAAAEGEDIENLLAALESLSADHQRVIELRHFEELPFKRIGEELGRTESAAQVLHARAVMRLGSILRSRSDP